MGRDRQRKKNQLRWQKLMQHEKALRDNQKRKVARSVEKLLARGVVDSGTLSELLSKRMS